MPVVRSQGVRIHYDLAGEGPPLVLIHGWTASARTNWELPGWVEVLAPHYRLLLPDLRGHGRSQKPHRKAAYSLPLFAADVLAVMEHAGVERARVMGYSMGGMTALELLAQHGERFTAAVIGGMGASFPGDRKADCCDEEVEAGPKMERRLGGTLKAVGAYVRHYDPIAQNAIWRALFRKGVAVRDPERLRDVSVPVLIVVGARDPLCPGTRVLHGLIPGARRVVLSGRNHISAVADPRYKQAVLAFFGAKG